jgi:PAS domain S-box-containing protein
MTASARPTGSERSFSSDDVIVTKTDLKGRITYANDVFCRVSAFTETELLGQPHNVIRHPGMPRGIFRLLWDTITERQELFAYAMNLAGDGAHYWVFAHVTPSYDLAGHVVGYHSNRRLPDPAVVRQIKPLYERLLQEERRHPHPAEAAQAGLDLLQEILAEQHTDYDRFIWALTSGRAA